MLHIKNLNVNYGKNQSVIENFHLSVKQGEIVSIVGESGSGKTTVIRSILGALPSSGKMTADALDYNGSSLLQNSKKDWRKIRGTEMSMIFQDCAGSLNPIKKIGKQFVDYICTHEEISKKDAYEKAVQMLAKTNLADPKRVMDRYPHQLSGGMRQRVGIAMAMTFQPKLLLADEPTSALDVTTQAQIVKQMLHLRDTYGTSIILVTHNVGVAAYMADQLIVMKHGKIVDQGTREEVLRHPKSEYTRCLLSAVPEMEGERLVG